MYVFYTYFLYVLLIFNLRITSLLELLKYCGVFYFANYFEESFRSQVIKTMVSKIKGKWNFRDKNITDKKVTFFSSILKLLFFLVLMFSLFCYFSACFSCKTYYKQHSFFVFLQRTTSDP